MENLKSLLSIFAQEEPVLQKLLQEGEVEKLAEYMKADKAGKIVYAEAFRARPLEKRRALAYIYGILLLNPEYGSPSNKFITNMFPQAAIDWPPFVNRDRWGHPECGQSQVSAFFTNTWNAIRFKSSGSRKLQ